MSRSSLPADAKEWTKEEIDGHMGRSSKKKQKAAKAEAKLSRQHDATARGFFLSVFVHYPPVLRAGHRNARTPLYIFGVRIAASQRGEGSSSDDGPSRRSGRRHGGAGAAGGKKEKVN